MIFKVKIKMKKIEKIFKALANANRLKIVKYLLGRRDGASVGMIKDAAGCSYKAASKHLVILFANDIVDRDQAGQQAHYRIADNPRPEISALLKLLR